jgi:predicted nucleic acid-binding protein
MKVYLDNTVVSAIAKDDTPTESDALDRLLAAYYQGKVDLVTSELTSQEIARYAGPKRTRLEQTFQRLQLVPVVQWDELLGIHVYADQWTCINSPMIERNPLYDSLLSLKLDRKQIDAQHVFVAAKQGCDFFLTSDGRVLKRAGAVRQLCGVTVWKPSDFVASQRW